MSKRYLVLLIITLISATLGTFFWGYWKLFSADNQVALGVYALVLGILFLSVTSLLAFLNENVPGAVLISLVCALPIFISGVNIYSLTALVVIFLANLFLNLRARFSRKSLVKPSVALTLLGLNAFITFFSLALAIIYFPQAQSSSRDFKLKIPDQVFSKIYENLRPQLGQSAVGNGTNAVAEKYFDSQIPQIRSQLLNQGITDESQLQEQVNKAKAEYLNQVKQNYSAQNTADSGQEGSLIKTSVESQLNSVIDNNRSVIPYILTISLFFSVTFFSSIFIIIILGLVQLYVLILIKSGIVAVSKQSIETERLTL